MAKPYVFLAVTALIAIFISSCGSDPVPKPRAYFRIALPDHTYQVFDTNWPYTFEYPAYAELLPDQDADAEPYWADLSIPRFGARLHLSYKRVDGNLAEYTEDARKMAMKHIARSTGIQEMMVSRPDEKVYGLVYDIRGSEAASPFQFFLTDSTHHFLRGALYFNMAPNNDSLAPVIDFLEEDILHLIGSLRWKQ